MSLNTSNIDFAINQNKDMYQFAISKYTQPNKQYISNNAKTDTFELTQRKFLENKEKAKKKNTAKKIIGISLGATAVVLAALCGKQIKNNGYVNLKFLKITDEQSLNLTNKVKGYWDDFVNISTNIGSVRDDFARQAVDKIDEKTPFKFIKRFSKKLESLYNDWTKSGVKKGYSDLSDKLKALNSLDEIQTAKLTNFDEFFNDIDISTRKILADKNNGVLNHFLGKQTDGKRRTIEEIFKISKKSIVADDKLNALYDKYLIKLTEAQKADDNLVKLVNDRNKIVKEAIERLRDTNIGNPISDAAGVILSLIGLGSAIGAAKDKEERKSVSINLGIPILTTIASVIIGSVKSISGVKSMVFGWVLGMIGSEVANVCDKLSKKKPQETVKA